MKINSPYNLYYNSFYYCYYCYYRYYSYLAIIVFHILYYQNVQKLFYVTKINNMIKLFMFYYLISNVKYLKLYLSTHLCSVFIHKMKINFHYK